MPGGGASSTVNSRARRRWGFCSLAARRPTTANPGSTLMRRQVGMYLASFDRLIGAQEYGRGHLKAQRLRRFQIDEQFRLDRLLNRKVGRFFSLENARGVAAGDAVSTCDTAAIADKSSRCDKLAILVHGGNFVLQR